MEKGYIPVLWVKAHSKYAYSAGQEGIVKADQVPDLIKGGYLIPVTETQEKKINPLPDDLPGRDKLFEAGFDDLQKIREAGDSLLDAGISNTTCKKINTYLKGK
jgi:hypothetical protein